MITKRTITQRALMSKESEETEVKKGIEWLKDEILTDMRYLEGNREIQQLDIKYQTLREVVQKINQLDEPEVLSPDWIKDNQIMWASPHGLDYCVPADELYGLLVPKQELPEKVVVPDFVFNHIKRYKDGGLSLWVAVGNGTDFELKDWMTGPNQELYAKAWLAYPNIEVEKEQKYILSINITDKASKTNYETFLNKRGIFHSMKNESFNSEEFNWTEEEIKDLESGEILFEHFATKVEEMEE